MLDPKLKNIGFCEFLVVDCKYGSSEAQKLTTDFLGPENYRFLKVENGSFFSLFITFFPEMFCK